MASGGAIARLATADPVHEHRQLLLDQLANSRQGTHRPCAASAHKPQLALLHQQETGDRDVSTHDGLVRVRSRIRGDELYDVIF